jgi:antitoxin (DNA-binding transcriptional repressor) of toxin-antitoxin stability system
MNATTIDVQEAQTHWQELLGLVLAGNEILVTLAQKPVMRLVPIQSEIEPRIAGLHAGMGWMSDDFDAPLPDCG